MKVSTRCLTSEMDTLSTKVNDGKINTVVRPFSMSSWSGGVKFDAETIIRYPFISKCITHYTQVL